MLPYIVNLFASSSQEASPTKHMIIVSNYELVEKSTGVFRSVCRSRPMPLLRRSCIGDRESAAKAVGFHWGTEIPSCTEAALYRLPKDSSRTSGLHCALQTLRIGMRGECGRIRTGGDRCLRGSFHAVPLAQLVSVANDALAGLTRIDRDSLSSGRCGGIVRTFANCTPSFRTVCRRRRRLAGTSCPFRRKRKFLDPYPFCIVVRSALR